MSEITHADYMNLVERIEKLEAFMKRELSRQPITAHPARTSVGGETKCFFETLSPEDRNKPTGISCPCRKCSPYSMEG